MEKGQRAVLAQVTGRVQRVGFRAWARSEAMRLGLTGWVRNEADGSVSALILGDEQRVSEMIDVLRKGPSAARVSEVSVEEVERVGEPPASFTIVR